MIISAKHQLYFAIIIISENIKGCAAMEYYHEIERVIKYIEDSLQSKFRVEDIINNIYCSLPHFYRVFYHITGDTVMSYVRKRKLSCAAMELINTDKSIIEIALDYGYESQQTFNRAFTKTFGISPGRFKNEKRNVNMYRRFDIGERSSDMTGLSFEDIEIMELEPMTAAAYHVYDDEVQEKETEKIISKAWKGLIDWQIKQWQRVHAAESGDKLTKIEAAKWAISRKLHIPPNTRYFGFENPWPVEKASGFGYECWAVMDKDSNVEGKLTAKDFKGGLYATLNATYGKNSNIKEAWQLLHRWLEQSSFTYGKHQWLEEHITIPEAGGFHGFKLFLAIEPVL